MLDVVKDHVLEYVPEGACAENVNKYWDIFVSYLFTFPLMFLHYTRILYSTDITDYRIFSKILLMVYLTVILTMHEFLRLVVVKLCTHEISMQDLANKAKSQYDNLSAKVTPVIQNLFKRLQGGKSKIGAALSDTTQQADADTSAAVNNGKELKLN